MPSRGLSLDKGWRLEKEGSQAAVNSTMHMAGGATPGLGGGEDSVHFPFLQVWR